MVTAASSCLQFEGERNPGPAGAGNEMKELRSVDTEVANGKCGDVSVMLGRVWCGARASEPP